MVSCGVLGFVTLKIRASNNSFLHDLNQKYGKFLAFGEWVFFTLAVLYALMVLLELSRKNK